MMLTHAAPGKEGGETACRFCGKNRNQVRTLLVSNDSAICDECIVTGLEIISHQGGQFYLRIAFLVFRAMASIGLLISVK